MSGKADCAAHVRPCMRSLRVATRNVCHRPIRHVSASSTAHAAGRHFSIPNVFGLFEKQIALPRCHKGSHPTRRHRGVIRSYGLHWPRLRAAFDPRHGRSRAIGTLPTLPPITMRHSTNLTTPWGASMGWGASFRGRRSPEIAPRWVNLAAALGASTARWGRGSGVPRGFVSPRSIGYEYTVSHS